MSGEPERSWLGVGEAVFATSHDCRHYRGVRHFLHYLLVHHLGPRWQHADAPPDQIRNLRQQMQEYLVRCRQEGFSRQVVKESNLLIELALQTAGRARAKTVESV